LQDHGKILNTKHTNKNENNARLTIGILRVVHELRERVIGGRDKVAVADKQASFMVSITAIPARKRSRDANHAQLETIPGGGGGITDWLVEHLGFVFKTNKNESNAGQRQRLYAG